MKKIKIIALLSAILMFAALFLILTNTTADQNNDKQNLSDSVHVISVVKAKKNIAPYTMISDEMIEVKNIIAEKSFEDFYPKKEDVIGCVAVADVFQGETISTKRVVKKEDAHLGLAYSVAEGMRAVTIPVSVTSGVANTLKVGNFVDVVVTIHDIETAGRRDDDEEEVSRKIPAAVALDAILNNESPANSQVVHKKVQPDFSYIAFQKMKILSLDDKFFIAANDPVTGNSYGTVTLEATPAQATQLILTRNVFSIDLILRNQTDEQTVNEPRSEILQPYQPNPEQ